LILLRTETFYMWFSPKKLKLEALELRAQILISLHLFGSKLMNRFNLIMKNFYASTSELDGNLEDGCDELHGRSGRNPLNLLRTFILKLKNQICELKMPERVFLGILACLVYSLCSMSMTFTNKAILSVYEFKYPLTLLLFQHTFTLTLVLLARSLGYISFSPKIKWSLVRAWYPVNILFLLMLISNTYAIKVLIVPMVTIFKNLTTTLTAMGDFILFGQPLSPGILASVTLMVASSLVAGYNDLKYDAQGYAWMALNCVVSSGYVLYMRFAMKKTQLNEWALVYYNNVLSIPMLLVWLLLSNEMPEVIYKASSFSNTFYFIMLWSGLSGFFISVSSFWSVRMTSPTTYSMVGSLNKIPLTILGVFIFKDKLKPIGAVSIAIGLAAGGLYSLAKQAIRPVELPRVSSNMLLEAK